MKRKQLIVLVFLFFASFFVAVFVGRGVKKTSVVPPTPTPAPAREALPSPFSKQPSNYSFSSLSSQPTTAYSFTVSEFFINNEVARVAKDLGFIGDPTQTQSTRGTFLRWKGTRGTLTLVPDRKTVVFSSDSVVAVTKKTVAAGQLVATANGFLSSLSLPNIPNNIAVVGTEYFAPQNNDPHKLPSAEGATVIQIDFEYKINGVPVYSDKLGSTSDVWVRLDADGNVLAFSVIPLPNLVQGKSVSVISMEEAAKRLIENKTPATSVVWSGSGDALVYLQEPPSSISVASGVLAYYYNSKESRVDPVYVFIGEGIVSGDRVKTVSAVSAVN